MVYWCDAGLLKIAVPSCTLREESQWTVATSLCGVHTWQTPQTGVTTHSYRNLQRYP